jgi:deoxycytidine triphosphate deaminase
MPTFLDKSRIAGKLPTQLNIEPFDYAAQAEEYHINLLVGETTYVEGEKKGDWEARKTAGLTLKPEMGTILLESREFVKNRRQLILVHLDEDLSRKGLICNSKVLQVGYEGKIIIPVFASRSTILRPGDLFVNLYILDAGARARKLYDGKWQGGKVCVTK